MFSYSYAIAIVLAMVALIALFWRWVRRPQPFWTGVRHVLFVLYLAVLVAVAFLPWPKPPAVPIRWDEILRRSDFHPFIPIIDRTLEAVELSREGYSLAWQEYVSWIFPPLFSLVPLAYFLRRDLHKFHSFIIWLICAATAFGIEGLQLVLNELSGVYYKHVSVNHFFLACLGAGICLLIMSGIRAIFLRQKGYSLVRNPERELERLREQARAGNRRGKLITKDTLWR